jgi:hypothetical protein
MHSVTNKKKRNKQRNQDNWSKRKVIETPIFSNTVPFRMFQAICRYLAEFKSQASSTTSSTLVNREGQSQASGSIWQNSFWKMPRCQTIRPGGIPAKVSPQ